MPLILMILILQFILKSAKNAMNTSFYMLHSAKNTPKDTYDADIGVLLGPLSIIIMGKEKRDFFLGPQP